MRNIEDIMIDGRALKDILEEDAYPDLKGVDLSDTNLSGVDLSDANLRGVNLRDANLRDADLRNSDLMYADLRGVNLSDANLRNSDLMYADLRDADLRDAYLRGADLRDADLRGADLIDADLIDANLRGADLSGCANEYVIGKMLNEPIIGYKACRNDIIVTLEIPKGAIVFSINGYKYRTNKAKVIAIDNENRAFSDFNNMSYYVGDEITVYDFNCIYNTECGKGIHFFLTRKEAEDYFYRL